MQGIGYLIINNKKILVLCRQSKTYRAFKLRLSGKDGNFFDEESKAISEIKLNKLLNGETIYL